MGASNNRSLFALLEANTQQQVADKMGIAQNAISRIEAGTHSPSLDMVERYADAIGLKLTLITK